MNPGYLSLSMEQVLVSLAIIFLAIGLMWINRTGLERTILVGAIRSFFQLWLIGYVLLWLFQSDHPGWLLLYVEVMILVGAWTSAPREKGVTVYTYLHLWIALHGAVLVIGGFLFWAVLRTPMLLNPHLLIPLMGMLIGNSANGAALAVHRLRGELQSHRGVIEAALTLGASPRRAMEPFTAQTLRNALIPMLNSMMLMGIVQLPGIMTGQILAGVLPQEAIRYQIVVVYMLVGAVALTCHVTVRLELRGFFNRHWALADGVLVGK